MMSDVYWRASRVDVKKLEKQEAKLKAGPSWARLICQINLVRRRRLRNAREEICMKAQSY
jgi:hypothetical protein